MSDAEQFRAIRAQVEIHDATNDCLRRYMLPLRGDDATTVPVLISTLRQVLAMAGRVPEPVSEPVKPANTPKRCQCQTCFDAAARLARNAPRCPCNICRGGPLIHDLRVPGE